MGNVHQNVKVVIELSPDAYARWDELTGGKADEQALEAIEARVASCCAVVKPRRAVAKRAPKAKAVRKPAPKRPSRRK